ncbi:uncharacterized protein FIBRA_07770 [Fibroporia radiculosa]|uniref:Fe2OG dioxygenase domain-containing protein n=1 Tax=Fibroporia radiculosa TaxID=599839 RepID=J4GFH8_9APHY|nr:uncharacterized protein FIBRA_07770 [Fibroporia radiculosa]CCM05543.1 predicted protein [Fibroporia radiculosa]
MSAQDSSPTTRKRKRSLDGSHESRLRPKEYVQFAASSHSSSTAGIPPRRNSSLKILTDAETLQNLRFHAISDGGPSPHDSLFDEPTSSCPRTEDNDTSNDIATMPTTLTTIPNNLVNDPDPLTPATRAVPPIPGLYFDPAVRLPLDLTEEVMWTCIRTYFQHSDADQVMLFERANSSSESSSSPSLNTGLPPVLTSLLSTLSVLLRPLLPAAKHALLFPAHPTPLARQAILNLYWPGDGITPHVDLLDRYGDGIVGVSLGSGCVMQFAKVRAGRGDEPASQRTDGGRARGAGERFGVYLPAGSVLVLTGDARYSWTHGIEQRMEDYVESEGVSRDPDGCDGDDARRLAAWLPRDVRLSVTFRWLLPGADVVGPQPPSRNA